MAKEDKKISSYKLFTKWFGSDRIVCPLLLALSVTIGGYYALNVKKEVFISEEKERKKEAVDTIRQKTISAVDSLVVKKSDIPENTTPLEIPQRVDTLYYYHETSLPIQYASGNYISGLSSRLNKKEINPLSIFLFASFMMVVLWLIFKNKFPKIEKELFEANDPDTLKNAIMAHVESLLQYHTPRKLKRTINKMRFQYQILKAENLIDENDEKKAKDFVAFCHYVTEKTPEELVSFENANKKYSALTNCNDYLEMRKHIYAVNAKLYI